MTATSRARSTLSGGITAVAIALGLVGCSGGSDATASPDPTDVTTTAAPTTTTPTLTTPATESVPPSTTMPEPTTTLSVNTTAAVTTPLTPEDQVREAYQGIYDGYWACLRAPLACDTSWLLEGSPSAAAMTNTMQALVDRDRYVGDDDVGYYVIESIEFLDDATAEVTACWWSTAVLYGAPIDPDRPAGPDNPATVVNNTPGSGRQVDRLTRDGAAWPLSSSESIDVGFREDVCRP